MGFVYADVKLTNSIDMADAEKHLIGEEEIRSMSITTLVDTGCVRLAINENIQEYLQLPVIDRRNLELADGSRMTVDIVGPVHIKFENRSTICEAIVLPGGAEPLLGAISLEAMDVLVDPLRNKLIVNPAHPHCGSQRLYKIA